MPISWHGQVTTVLDCALKRHPSRVLDVGAGYGAYGALLRQYLPDALIIGVEPYIKYRAAGRGKTRWWGYDQVITEAWPSQHIAETNEYDVALCVDVIEHVRDEDAPAFIDGLLAAARAVIIATPHDPDQWPQDDLPNKREAHVSRWPLSKLRAWPVVEAHHLSESIVVVLEREGA